MSFNNFDISFYRNKKVLVTGHTGFKGSWLCTILKKAGAHVIGYALEPPTQPSLFEISNVGEGMTSIIGDVRDFALLKKTFDEFQPEIVFHLAAQPIVRKSYEIPRETYETNVMGTVNILECVRQTKSVRSVINITTDKVYENKEWCWGYRENDALNGFDPYSNSKSCSELITDSYKKSFFSNCDVAISTVRAGNVIGGGDFAIDRIIPDCIKAIIDQKVVEIRNPYSTRPYQHVLEPLFVYLMIAAMQMENKELIGQYNVGPDDVDCFQTGRLVKLLSKKWGEGLQYRILCKNIDSVHEAAVLRLDCSKVKNAFGWKPCWNLDFTMEKIVEWTKAYITNQNIKECMYRQIEQYIASMQEA